MMPLALDTCRSCRTKGRVGDFDGGIIEASDWIWIERIHVTALTASP